MKYIIWVFVICTLSIGITFGGMDYSNEQEYSEVQNYDFNLQTKFDGEKLQVNWKKYSWNEKLKWYKFVYSKTNSNLQYPNDTSEYVWNNASITSHRQYLELWNYYVRLCAITEKNSRYCSKVKKVVVKKEINKPIICTMEYAPVCGIKDWKYKTYWNKCWLNAAGAEYKYYWKCKIKEEKIKEGKIEDKKNKIESNLSEIKKQKINIIIDKFIKKLESKNYSDKQNIKVLDKIIYKIEKIKSNPKYTELAEYLIILLEGHKNKYIDELDVFEDIFKLD